MKDFSELHHVIEQHVTNAYGTQFKDLDQNALKHMISSTVENGTLTDVQDHPSGRRFVFERDWGSEIGTNRERISRVVMTESEELVTAFPVRNFKRPIGTALGSLARKYGSKVAKVGIIFGLFFDLTIGTSPLAAPTTSGPN